MVRPAQGQRRFSEGPARRFSKARQVAAAIDEATPAETVGAVAGQLADLLVENPEATGQYIETNPGDAKRTWAAVTEVPGVATAVAERSPELLTKFVAASLGTSREAGGLD